MSEWVVSDEKYFWSKQTLALFGLSLRRSWNVGRESGQADVKRKDKNRKNSGNMKLKLSSK